MAVVRALTDTLEYQLVATLARAPQNGNVR